MPRSSTIRRGNCLTSTLLGLAVIGILLAIAGVIAFVVTKPGDALKQLQADVTALVEGSTVIEAPGTGQAELKEGGMALLLSPGGQVGDKVVPTPPTSVTYTFTVTDPEGVPVQLEMNKTPRNGTEPFYLFGFGELKKAGSYTIKVEASDGSTPAAIVAASASKAEIERLGTAAGTAAVGALGGCGAICGLAMAAVFGIIGLILRNKSAQPDPLAH